MRLVFEIRYPDDQVVLELPRVHSSAAGLRVAGLLDEIGRTPSADLREYLVRKMAQAAWRDHPEATSMRALLGVRPQERPGAPDGPFEIIFSYDFAPRDDGN